MPAAIGPFHAGLYFVRKGGSRLRCFCLSGRQLWGLESPAPAWACSVLPPVPSAPPHPALLRPPVPPDLVHASPLQTPPLGSPQGMLFHRPVSRTLGGAAASVQRPSATACRPPLPAPRPPVLNLRQLQPAMPPRWSICGRVGWRLEGILGGGQSAGE